MPQELEAEAIAGNQHNKQELTLAYDLTNRKVVGKIDLSPFTNLEKLDIRAGIFPHLDTSKCAGLPIRELIIYTSSDTEDFDLKDFPNLVKLSAFGYDPIRNLDLTANTKLEEIELSGETARTLDLKTFSHLTNLKKLELGYANGSFKSLEHCTNLEYLWVVDKYHGIIPKDGIEYLDLNKLNCLYLGIQLLPYEEWRSSGYAHASKPGYSDPTRDPIKAALEPYDWDIRAWKLVNYPDLINNDKKALIKELDKRIDEVEKATPRYPHKSKLEILQDFRTQKLKEVVFP